MMKNCLPFLLLSFVFLLATPAMAAEESNGSWEYVCENRYTEVVGIGLGNDESTQGSGQLGVQDIGEFEDIVLQVAGRSGSNGGSIPAFVSFTDSEGNTVVDSTATVGQPVKSWSFSAMFDAGSFYEMEIDPETINPKHPRGFLGYIGKSVDEEWTSIGRLNHQYVYGKNCKNGNECEYATATEIINLPSRDVVTDVYVSAVVIDNNNPERVFNASAQIGSKTTVQSRSESADGTGLDIFRMVLSDVPISENTLRISVESPAGDGESGSLIGVNAAYPCAGVSTLTPLDTTTEQVEFETTASTDTSEGISLEEQQVVDGDESFDLIEFIENLIESLEDFIVMLFGDDEDDEEQLAMTPTPTTTDDFVSVATPEPTKVPTPTTEESATVESTPIPINNNGTVVAFPGAEGFGAVSKGGRGGRVIEVTNLKDSGDGSFRAAAEASGARTIVFKVNGVIALKTPVSITGSKVTIAGQTAPGLGITLRNDPSNTESPLHLNADDVVIRYLRVRPGPSKEKVPIDAVTIFGGDRVIVDHSSFSWATDEVFAAFSNEDTAPGIRNLTVQRSIISEGLHCSTHPEGCHSKGMLLGRDGSGRFSIHHNLFADNITRNPRFNTDDVVDVVNNVIYNKKLEHSSSIALDNRKVAKVNYINNFLKVANNDISGNYFISVDPRGKGIELYVSGNISPRRPNDSMSDDEVMKPKAREFQVSKPHSTADITTQSAKDAFVNVLADVGATKPGQDAVDKRVISNVRNEKGGLIDDPSEVGGWPSMGSGDAYVDSDKDGMADDWERQNGLNPNDQSDGSKDANNDGYTNLEEFLHHLTL